MKKKVLMAALLVAGMGMSSSNVLAQTVITEGTSDGIAYMHRINMQHFRKNDGTFLKRDFIVCNDPTLSNYRTQFSVSSTGKVTASGLYLFSSYGSGVPNQPMLYIEKKTGNQEGFDLKSSGYQGFKAFDIYASLMTVNAELKVEGKISCKNELNVTKINTEEIQTENIRTSDITVDMNNAADYVFDPTYNLQDLSEVESYVKENKHLPGIPSAAEMAENGMSVAQMSNLLLEKIEELTLHMIELQKENNALKSRIESLEK
ncbi:MAG: hypothetical protein IJ916_05470 [Paludibacteraceae bacterium]|nr:hypothetical protein [Paludibacteraceae bacterium]